MTKRITKQDLERMRSVTISADAIPSRARRAAQSNIVERSWNEDLPAVERMLKAGHTPPSTEGAAQYERELDADS